MNEVIEKVCAFLLASAVAGSGYAQNSDATETIEEITVVAERLNFGIDGYIEPEVSYDQIAINALAVSTLSELLEEIGPDLAGGRGRQSGPPVVLVNGQRIASFREIRSYPPESVDRVEVYPEDVALQFGYRADQKVVNFVLKPRFRATIARLSADSSTEGGAENGLVDTSHLRILESKRLNVSAEVNQRLPLHESDRDIPALLTTEPASPQGNLFGIGGEIDPVLSTLAGEPVFSTTLPDDLTALSLTDLLASANNPDRIDERSARTLITEQVSKSVNASYTFPVGTRLSATLSGEFEDVHSDGDQGIGSISYVVPTTHPASLFANDVTVARSYPNTLSRDMETRRSLLNATLTGHWRGWSWNWLNSHTQSDRDVHTDRALEADDFLFAVNTGDPSIDPLVGPAEVELRRDHDSTETTDTSSHLLVRGRLFDTPRGPVRTTSSVAWRSIDQDSRDSGGATVHLSRDVRELRFSLDAPVFTASNGARLLFNTNLETTRYSDFGTLNVFGGGFTWRTGRALRLSGSLTREEGAPGMAQLGDPVSRFPSRRVFDFVTGQSVDATLVTGGNPALRSDTRDVFNLNARFEPFDRHNLTFTLDYVDSETDNPILTFPSPNAEIEAAFPNRFIRDASGTLVEFDTRPINLDKEKRRELRWGLHYTRTVRGESARQGRSDGRSRNNNAADRSRSREFRGWRGGRGQNRTGGRLRLSLNHTFTLEDELTIGPGIRPLDYVGISNAGRQRGGAEHEVTLRGSYSYRALTARFNFVWRDSRTTLPGSTGLLRYDDQLQANLALVYSFNRGSGWVRQYPFLESARVKLTFRNLFDTHQRVRNQSGEAPPGFSRDEIDPSGRVVALEFRKVFR